MSIVDWSKAPKDATAHCVNQFLPEGVWIKPGHFWSDNDSEWKRNASGQIVGTVTLRPDQDELERQRESAVLEMLDHFRLGSDKQELLRAICFALYDAGYRKVTPCT